MQLEIFLVNLPYILFWKRSNDVYSSRKKMILKLLNSFLAPLMAAPATEATFCRKFMGAKESLAWEYEMHSRPTLFSIDGKAKKVIQQCYKSIIFFYFLKHTMKPEPHSLVQTVNYDNKSTVLIHIQQGLGTWLERGLRWAVEVIVTNSLREADRMGIQHP